MTSRDRLANEAAAAAARYLRGSVTETWIRAKLGENLVNPRAPKDHKRIDFDARDCTKDNKDLCDLFANDLNGLRMFISSNKGMVRGYIISEYHYNKYNYWDSKYCVDGVNGDLPLPNLYSERVDGLGGTVYILCHLVEKALELM